MQPRTETSTGQARRVASHARIAGEADSSITGRATSSSLPETQTPGDQWTSLFAAWEEAFRERDFAAASETRCNYHADLHPLGHHGGYRDGDNAKMRNTPLESIIPTKV